MPPELSPPTDAALPLHVVNSVDLTRWCATQPDSIQRWVTASGYKASLGEICLLPDAAGKLIGAVFGFGDAEARARGRFHIARAVAGLPGGIWALQAKLDAEDSAEAALGWLLAGYKFGRYRPAKDDDMPRLVVPEGIDAARIAAMAHAEYLTRDLINTPASDMGPQELEEAFLDLARRHGAKAEVTRSDDLLAANFPMIHAVGRASTRAPRLLDLRWGSAGPKLTLVGKGVCFDTGGLDIKPATGMGLMKKDMGGAATVMGLAQMVMTLNLPVQLRVLVPAVENAISGNALRPQDILTSRKGLTVEINNTDAEGRLVLADALAYGAEETPDLMISMATLTGAARVAVGPDLAPYFTDDDGFATALDRAAKAVRDPVWRMPFWPGYEAMIEPGIADLDNAPSGGMAGAITAALFLRRFADVPRYAHFDIYGWQPTAAPARPKGGVGQGARAILAALPQVLGL